MPTCRRRVINKDPEPLRWKNEVCGRNATHEQDDGLPLCERHFNKWRKKMAKRDVDHKTKGKASPMYVDKNSLSYWFPRIGDAKLPVPLTRIVRVPTASIQKDLFRPLDGKEFEGPAKIWLEVLKLAAEEIGFPCFLRTGHTSGKHDWDRTCYVASAKDLASHVLALIEFSETCDVFGLPWIVWAVRELLPTKPVATVYRGMPLCREFRCFVEDGKLICMHPYWPAAAIEQGLPEGETLSKQSHDLLHNATVSEVDEIKELAKRAGKACGGRWSVDILDTERGWFVTDMALMDQSSHWPGCPHGKNET